MTDASDVARLLAGLPELQRRVIQLRIIDGLSVKDTARVLGRAEGTIKASMHRGLARLKRTKLAVRSGNE